jgi:16S rRNA (guanine966-N2)-methyltransferase
MRIIAGNWRGRPIISPKGEVTRPTADRTREALFSMLVSRLGSFEDLRVADLFAGSGALGLEALSRGAAHCTFVEHDRAAVDALKANIAKLGASADVRAQSVLSLGNAPLPYDLILMDPPYETGAGEVALDKLMRHGWIGPSTWISLETSRRETVSIKGLSAEQPRDYGKARINLLRMQNVQAPDAAPATPED